MSDNNKIGADSLLALAQRCEAATGADAELDMLIWAALNGVTVTYPSEGHPMTPGRGGRVEGTAADGNWCLLGFIDPGQVQRNWSPYGGEDRYPKVTASIDAALTLVPGSDGVGWRMTDGAGGPTAEVWCVDYETTKELYHVGANPAATPALALCAAALRARAAQGGVA